MDPSGTRGEVETLVERARGGDLDAFERLMRRHNQRLYRVARAVLGSETEAEDAVQEAYVRAFTRLDQYRPGDFGAWLVTITVNEARGRLRARARRAARVDASAGMALASADDAHTDPEGALARAEIGALVESAIDELPDGHREVFVLREVEHMDTRDAAAALGLSEAAVRTRLHRARARLRELLSDRIASELPHAFSFAGDRCDRIVASVLADLGKTGTITH